MDKKVITFADIEIEKHKFNHYKYFKMTQILVTF